MYRRAGATVHAIGCAPDGWNINDGIGSTHLEPLIEAVRAQGADLGLAHDGDADRCLAVTAAGDVVDGDEILAVCALALHERGALTGDTVVATVMSNLGFHHAMRDAGIAVQTTAVGDRYVLEALRAGNLSLGGEQSGHLVFLDHATTGDGLLTGLALMARMAATGASLAELAGVVHKLPQILINVPVTDRTAVAGSAEVADGVRAVEAELGDTGRVLLRPSGTEQLVRVMVEAPTQDQADVVAGRLADVVAARRLSRRAAACPVRGGPRPRIPRSGGRPPVPSFECAESWDTSVRRTPGTSSWRACAGSSTGATTPPASRCWPTVS